MGPAAPQPREYVVKHGDTLYSVAHVLGATMRQVMDENALATPVLYTGQVLRVRGIALGAMPSAAKPQQRAAVSSAISTLAPSAPARKAAQAPMSTSFLWPVRGRVVSSYGRKAGGLYNDGINIAAPRGTPVRAAQDGTVAYVGHAVASYGNLVLIRHTGGVITAYAHLGLVSAKQGMHVKKGDVIGSVGATGAVTDAQLHFEIRKGAETLDPARYL
jgi:murein DD-endopeptidase MepM/ murein hydrolase activator NlpD